ncbi:hypothetical protein ACJIZ3_002685 [Penstemon smallii]|uniref:Uncharacterized protein n=1 Tax=Penstemon smallii TaxID=265156 RepID=A0ABD3U739_9LAMI
MSGFFSLGGNNNNNNNNKEIYNKGFELWQQCYQLHHQITPIQDHHVVGPSKDDGRLSMNIRSGNNNNNINNEGRGGINCQDCGNQAKKDCEHMRCRTCCKSRGYPCQTHVKSTWIPAAKRRERQQQVTVGGEVPKRLRESTSGGGGSGGGGGSTLARGSGFELGHFPPEVNCSAVFRCVRVSTMDDADEHLAYHTAVRIGGHVFKGILYDQGPENRYPGGGGGGESSSNLISAVGPTTVATTTTNYPPNVTMNEYSSVYPTPLNAFMAGTQFFPPPRH